MWYTFEWRDVVEILFFSSLFYYFGRWLSKDKQKNLCGYFIGYCAAAIAAYFMQLSTVSTFMIMYSPVFIMLFIIIHQETLQKNFITSKNKVPVKTYKPDWLHLVLSSCLQAAHNNQPITIALEHTDNIIGYVDIPFLINGNIRKELLNLFFTSGTYKENSMIWITSTGIFRGVNVTWKRKLYDEPLVIDDTYPQRISTKLDCLILHIDPATRLFTITADGKVHQNISPEHAARIINKHIAPPFKRKKGVYYEKRYDFSTTQKHIT